jgi:1-aminocyclopropane-1-carboxylate deaminase/D-cysteine desulfhydrase-like pyridoxal-dependent ACC family enzyme
MLPAEKNFLLQKINNEVTSKQQVELSVLRLDLVHPTINGNKYFKLKYNLEAAEKLKLNTLLTFGGAYSNHIVAVAAAGKEFGFTTIGIIRGEKTLPLNNNLQFAVNCGMQLHYVSREEYKQQRETQFNNSFTKSFSNCYLIPEGGSNELAIKGCKEILKLIENDFDYICCACGTGATFSGIVLSLNNNQKAIGFQVLKAQNYIKNEVQKWLTHFQADAINNWTTNEMYHFGGYAKTNKDLLQFVIDFENENKIAIEPIYTGKMFFGINDLLKQNYFPKGSKILAIHTGGLV